MLILILLLPFLGFLSGAIFGRYLGRTVCYTTTGGIFISLMLSLFLFYEILAFGLSCKLYAMSWIVVDTLNIDWCFCFDSLTSVMLVVVTFVSTLVHLYSTEYMEHDPHLQRFMCYLSLFTFFMLILITGNNFLQMFVGWEGVGLSSYLLINFWFTRIQANKAAIKAMLVNRIGDFALLLAIFSIYFVFNSLDYDVIFSLVPLMLESKIIFGSLELPSVDTICVLLFIGAMGKSAQLGLHTWLPDAMEGPTPVSALIHAATMVTAGVFLIVRCSFLFEYSPLALSLVTFVGSGTAFFAATTGLFQNDMKRVIAYSTCSQLGYMIFSCGLSGYEVGVFHLSNHAFFKALLFLGAGSIIHAVADEQDMRKMGGLKNLLPFSYSIMVIGSLALMGFPFLAGFYSKDTILEVAYAKYTNWGHFVYYLGTFAAFFTAFYSVRLLFLVFLSESNGNRVITLNAHEASWRMGLPLFILSLLSITVGFLTRDFFVGFGTNFWGCAIFILPKNYIMLDVEFIDLFFKLLPLLMSLIGAGLAFFIYAFDLSFFFHVKKTKSFKIIYNFLNRKWYYDRLYNEFMGQKILDVSYSFAYKDVDRGLIENLGPSGIVNLVHYTFNFFKELQSGFLFHYIFMFLVSIVLLFLIVISFSIAPIPRNLLIFFVGCIIFEGQ
jgi:proton-translocating NADH-quinone oxidoreductase chain L